MIKVFLMMATAYKSLHSSSSCSERSEEWERVGTRGSGHRAPSSAAAGGTLGNDEILIPFILFSFDLIFTKINRTPNKIGYLSFHPQVNATQRIGSSLLPNLLRVAVSVMSGRGNSPRGARGEGWGSRERFSTALLCQRPLPPSQPLGIPA